MQNVKFAVQQGYEVRSCAAQINRIYWTHNPSTGHIRIRIHYKLDNFVYCMISPDLFIGIWY